MNTQTTIEVLLTVKDNLTGTGNTGGGNYNYTFDPDVVHVNGKNTEIVYKLVETDRARFQITTLYSTDTRDQLVDMEVRDGGAELKVVHRNAHKQLTVVSVLVNDRKHGLAVSCDPQVTNDPPADC